MARLFTLLTIFLLAILVSNARAAEKDARKTVIPFDFVSKFDDGRYGADGGRLDLEEARPRRRLHPARVDAGRPRFLPEPAI